MARSLALALVLAPLLFFTVIVTSAAALDTGEITAVSAMSGGLTLEIVVPEPEYLAQPTFGNVSRRIELDGYVDGPEGLPIKEMLVALPPFGAVDVAAEPLAPTRILEGSAPMASRPRVVAEQDGLALQAGLQRYPLDLPQSLPLAALVEEGFVRDLRVGRLRFAPMAYLGEGRWELTPRFEVRITFPELPVAQVTEEHEGELWDSAVEISLVNGDQAMGWRSSAPPVRPTQVYTLPQVTWRIGIARDGIYALSYETLDGAKVPLAGIEPDDVHLFSMGQEVALQEIGMGDGSLDPGDAFLFYGQKFHGSVQDEKYTDENVYWLSVDASSPGRRMATRMAGGGLAPATAGWYTDTVRAEENNRYWGRWSDSPGTATTWFWERIKSTYPVTHTYPVTLSALAATPHTATLQVEVAARNESSADPDHHLGFNVNGTRIGDAYWDGAVGLIITTPFTSTLLVEGANDVGLTLLTDVGTQDIYIDRVEITFRRQTVAQDGELALTAAHDGEAVYTLTGFGGAGLGLYELGEPRAPTLISGTTVYSDGVGWNVLVTDTGPVGQPYLAVEESAIRETPALERYEPALGLLSPAKGTDEIIIVPGQFYTAVLPLADHRRAEGLRVEVVRVEDIYPLFNGGVVHPRAIRDFVAYAYGHWAPPAPAYVLLFGDGHFNPKGYNPASYGEPAPVWIPPFLDFVDPWQGEVPVDTRFGQIVGDDTLPDVAVGRIPANSVQDVEDAVAKIIAYETGASPAKAKLIFAADNPDDGGDFEASMDRLAADFAPSWMQRDRVYLTDYCGAASGAASSSVSACPGATAALTQTWSEGALMLTYAGHGSVNRWAHEPLLRSTQIDSLQPGHELPFVMTLNCLDGYWMMPPKYPGFGDARSVAEWSVLAADHGSVASFSPAGLGTNSAAEVIARSVFDAAFNGGVERFGDLALAGQLTVIGWPAHQPQITTLFGDPAGRLAMPSRAFLPSVEH